MSGARSILAVGRSRALPNLALDLGVQLRERGECLFVVGADSVEQYPVGCGALLHDRLKSVDTVFGLKLVFSLPTFAFAMLGLWLFRSYPITEASHHRVLMALQEGRRSRRES